MIATLLAALFRASRHLASGNRLTGYALAVSGASREDLVRLIGVLTEGAMHGPDAARGLAVELGG